MTSGSLDLWAIIPELILAGTGLALVPVAAFVHGHGNWRYLPMVLTVTALLAALGFTARMLAWEDQAVFSGTYAIDGFAHVFKLILELGGLIGLLTITAHFRGRDQVAHAPMALLFVTLGGVGLVSALDLGLIVLFLQMLSLPAYLLVTLVRSDRRGNEATLKYFIYAAAALAIMAYGLTFLYGMTGSLELRTIGRELAAGGDAVWVALSLGLILIGYGFEMTLVPFHFWAPDVYSGATAPVTGFISVVPKVAGFAAFLRFALLAYPDQAAAWPTLVAVLAVATMTLGNLVALRQSRLKRLLAYSSIAQAGYVLVAVAVAGRVEGALSAAAYYLSAYLFMNLAAFAVVAQVERHQGSDELAQYRGFGLRAPWAGAVLALALLSLAGLPPLAGFAGKVFVLTAAIDGDMTWLAVVAAVNMVIGLYYYVAVLAEMYLRRPPAPSSATPHPSGRPGPWTPSAPLAPGGPAAYWPAYLLTTAGTLALGILPGPALRLLEEAQKLVS